MITVCPKCQVGYGVRESQIGKNTTCKKCGTRFSIVACQSASRPRGATSQADPPTESPGKTARPKPDKFRVWYLHEEADMLACCKAVRAWVDAQKAAGIEILGSTNLEFELQPRVVLPGTDLETFRVHMRTAIEKQGEDPSDLFFYGNVAVYPCYSSKADA